MNPYIYILEPRDILDIATRLRQLQLAAECGRVVHWNREGYVRIIPHAVLVQSLQTYGDWATNCVQFGSVIPLDASVIRWDQTISLDQAASSPNSAPNRSQPPQP